MKRYLSCEYVMHDIEVSLEDKIHCGMNMHSKPRILWSSNLYVIQLR